MRAQALEQEKDPSRRLHVLNKGMYWMTFQRVARGLYIRHHITFALRLAQLFLEAGEDRLADDVVDFFMKGTPLDEAKLNIADAVKISKNQKGLLARLGQLEVFKGLLPSFGQTEPWAQFCDPLRDRETDDPEGKITDPLETRFKNLPAGWHSVRVMLPPHACRLATRVL